MLRGVFTFGIDIGVVSPLSMPMLAHPEYTVGRRPAFSLGDAQKLSNQVTSIYTFESLGERARRLGLI